MFADQRETHLASSVFRIFSSQLSLTLFSSFSDVSTCSCSSAFEMIRTSPSDERNDTICFSGGTEGSKVASPRPPSPPPDTRAVKCQNRPTEVVSSATHL